MAFFKRKKKADFIDLGERMRKQQQRADEIKSDLADPNAPSTTPTTTTNSGESTGGSFFSFFGNNNSTTTSPATNIEPTSELYESRDFSTPEQKRKKLAKRLQDITTRLEELSNSIYKIEQRLELIERKMGVGY